MEKVLRLWKDEPIYVSTAPGSSPSKMSSIIDSSSADFEADYSEAAVLGFSFAASSVDMMNEPSWAGVGSMFSEASGIVRYVMLCFNFLKPRPPNCRSPL